MTTRRMFFTRLAVIVGGIAGFSACRQEQEPRSSGIDRKLLNAFADTIIPKDQDAGAVEAGIPEQLLQLFSKKPTMEKNARLLLVTIDGIARGRFLTPFQQCDLQQREMVLDIMIKSRNQDYRPARTTMFRLRGRIVKAFYSSAAGWQMLAYTAPYPEGYPDFNRPPPA